jgi:hypothetical protein
MFILFYAVFKEQITFKTLISLAILFRLIFLLSLPNLSNDFYRFIWDGRLIRLGFNPFMSLPNEFIQTEHFQKLGHDANELYTGQGSLSPGNYSCYAPLNQLFFFLGALIVPNSILGNVIVLRVFMILADIGIFWIGKKILRLLDLPLSNLMLYALNPFIIIELTGNLHFEGIMVFFMLVAIYFLLQDKYKTSAIFLAFSISVKLIPLLFIPLFLRKLGQLNILKYLMITIFVSILLFLPFYTPGLLENFMSSIDLYFRKFEFNASIYYIIRWIGYQYKGWNIIQQVGPLLGLVVFIAVIIFAILRKNEYSRKLIQSMLLVICIYYFLATTVHPWYIVIPLTLSVFTTFRFVVVWSLTAMLSYSAYSNEFFEENLVFVVVEYQLVFISLIFELLPLNIRKFRILNSKGSDLLPDG